MKNLYRTIGCKPSADPLSIKSSYRKKALQFHPDRSHGRSESSDEFMRELNEAYRVLSNSDSREEYDRLYKEFEQSCRAKRFDYRFASAMKFLMPSHGAIAFTLVVMALSFVGWSYMENIGDDSTGVLYPPEDIEIKYHQEWQIPLYHSRIAEFENSPIGYEKIVFLGDSITLGIPDWNNAFSIVNIVNRGIAGDTTEGVLARVPEILHYEPQAVFLLIGIHDIFDSGIEGREKITAEYVAGNIFKIARSILRKSPSTKVFIQTLLPVDPIKYKDVNGSFPDHRVSLNNQIVQINSHLRAGTQKDSSFRFIDLYKMFVDDVGMLKSDLSHDGVHLNEYGYKVWGERVQYEILRLEG